MRALLLLVVALSCTPARADLYTAQLAYHKGDYERAFKDYRELAELGQPLAQYNLATLYAKGQGVRQSELNAYAWATLAAESGEVRGRSLAEELRPGLAPGSEKIAADIVAPFSRAALDVRLMPKMEDNEGTQARCHLLKWGDVTYPEDARSSGIQGDVVVDVTVDSNGSSRNPRVVYAIPTKLFEAAARAGALHLQWQPMDRDGKAIHCYMMYRFKMNYSKDEYPDLERLVRTTLKKAEAGDTSSELLYGLLVAGLPQLGRPKSEAVPWFLKAAQAGSALGQYMIGSSLLFGMGCRCEENKGEVWLRKAAEADEASAQVALAAYAMHGAPDARNTKLADVWLERAAAHGDHDGVYYLSALLAATPVESVRDPKRALTLFGKLRSDERENPTAVEVHAAALANSGAFAEAVKAERKAIAMARALKWDVAPLTERLAKYESGQPWYGDLLAL